ncbi:hypothetical protein AMAG_19919 [Allomyces macrogynus ATCC 38327]|uniref:Protein kinase domain-containing protein n=1 Tax=Allomyces macrogynus (strain ATCC 38327) TaxID=578462 RepID=A0A0L0T3T6_ALLM3|nr:hypothetical protein AMAG_19919 [Allomyces macrogynus ATCC 38327]|eukprot:KNE69370.1 hypothetical protein AMAG_19919 [Allomyces macrogynus ATCC 38327]
MAAHTNQLGQLAVTAHEFIVGREPFARSARAEVYRTIWPALDLAQVVMKRQLLPSTDLGKTVRDELAKEALAWVAASDHKHVLPLLGVGIAASAPFLITP